MRALWERSAYDRGFISNPFAGDQAATAGLRRTEALLDELGRPHDRIGIIHIAGSKGKGSTAVFAEALLIAAGKKTGRYSQPHLHSFRERIVVDGEPISEEDFARLLQRGFACSEAAEARQPELGQITAFELTTALALDHFAATRCDYAVVEVGLGGTLDATNVVAPVVSVIATLDLEHTAILGDTLSAIAAQKAGIIKQGRPVVVAAQPAAPMAVIESIAERHRSRIYKAGVDWSCIGTWQRFTASGFWGVLSDLRTGLPGNHQMENAGTALAAATIALGGTLPLEESRTREALAGASLPGRFEIVQAFGPRIVVDGAHTPRSAAALAKTAAAEGYTPSVFVLGFLGDKDASTFAEHLQSVASAFVVAKPNSPRASDARTIADLLQNTGIKVIRGETVRSAIETAVKIAGPAGTVIVTGSFSTVADAREHLGLATRDIDLSQ
jgi:dihydrofolate synthase/folylpolyglutamate synthase